MRVALRVVLYLIALIVLILLAGFLLPSAFKTERSVSINAPAERIYPLLATTKSWKLWTVWNQRDPNMQISYSGPDAGVGAKWAWKSKTEGDGAMEFIRAETNKQLSYTLVFDDMAPTNGELVLTPKESTTLVTWRMTGDAGVNPIARWFGYFMDRIVGPDFEAGLTNLKRIAER